MFSFFNISIFSLFLAHLVVDVDGDIVEQTGKDDKKHFNVNKFTYTYDFAKKSQVQFENLFPDNEILSKYICLYMFFWRVNHYHIKVQLYEFISDAKKHSYMYVQKL